MKNDKTTKTWFSRILMFPKTVLIFLGSVFSRKNVQPESPVSDKKTENGPSRWQAVARKIVFISAFFVFLAGAVLGARMCIEKGRKTLATNLQTWTKNEQREYLEKIGETLTGVEEKVHSFEGAFSVLLSGKKLDTEEKKMFMANLLSLEAVGISLNDAHSDYFNDYSIQYSPFSDEGTTSFVCASRNFSIAIERFVRQSEVVFLGSSEISKQQVQLLQEQYYDILWHLENLKSLGLEEISS